VRYWSISSKADPIPRELADRHYTRQTPGSKMWTRPGYVQILRYTQANGRSAAWCWWRPKWEAGVLRKDRLYAIECTLFRNETRVRSSDLIREAVDALYEWQRAWDVCVADGLITGVSSSKTAEGRSADNMPGHCYRCAGWVDYAHPGRNTRADVWLWHPMPSAALSGPREVG
jgi:hypothetical protein